MFLVFLGSGPQGSGCRVERFRVPTDFLGFSRGFRTVLVGVCELLLVSVGHLQGLARCTKGVRTAFPFRVPSTVDD